MNDHKKFLGNLYAASNKSKLSSGSLKQLSTRFGEKQHEKLKSILSGAPQRAEYLPSVSARANGSVGVSLHDPHLRALSNRDKGRSIYRTSVKRDGMQGSPDANALTKRALSQLRDGSRRSPMQ